MEALERQVWSIIEDAQAKFNALLEGKTVTNVFRLEFLEKMLRRAINAALGQ